MKLLIVLLVVTFSTLAAAGPVERKAQCTSLEALGRVVQAKLAAGYKPTKAQQAYGEKRLAWYMANCQG